MTINLLSGCTCDNCNYRAPKAGPPEFFCSIGIRTKMKQPLDNICKHYEKISIGVY